MPTPIPFFPNVPNRSPTGTWGPWGISSRTDESSLDPLLLLGLAGASKNPAMAARALALVGGARGALGKISRHPYLRAGLAGSQLGMGGYQLGGNIRHLLDPSIEKKPSALDLTNNLGLTLMGTGGIGGGIGGALFGGSQAIGAVGDLAQGNLGFALDNALALGLFRGQILPKFPLPAPLMRPSLSAAVMTGSGLAGGVQSPPPDEEEADDDDVIVVLDDNNEPVKMRLSAIMKSINNGWNPTPEKKQRVAKAMKAYDPRISGFIDAWVEASPSPSSSFAATTPTATPTPMPIFTPTPSPTPTAPSPASIPASSLAPPLPTPSSSGPSPLDVRMLEAALAAMAQNESYEDEMPPTGPEGIGAVKEAAPYVVQEGDNLWSILASQLEGGNRPENWSLIAELLQELLADDYNRQMIQSRQPASVFNPSLIYAGQQFRLPKRKMRK